MAQYNGVSAEKFRALSSEQTRALNQADWSRAIHMHLASLENWRKLVRLQQQ